MDSRAEEDEAVRRVTKAYLDQKVLADTGTRRAHVATWEDILAEFDAIVAEMRNKFVMKDRAYANDQPFGNIKRCERIGIPASTGAFIRMTDKFSRLESLIALEQSDPEFAATAQHLDDSKLDNAFDLGVYAIIWQILYRMRLIGDQMPTMPAPAPVGVTKPEPVHPKIQELMDLAPGPNNHLPCGCVGSCVGHR